MKKGFTLIELLLAIGFLVFALASILAVFANCLLLNEYNRELTRAISHAQYIMEGIKNQDFSNLENNVNAGVWDWTDSDIENQGLIALTSEAIDTNEVGSDSSLLDVVVTVNWMSRGNRPRSIILETLITEP